MGEHGADDRMALPREGTGFLAAVIGDDVDCEVLCDAAALVLDPADPLPDIVEFLVGVWSRQAFVELAQFVLQACRKPFCDALLFLRARLGITIEAHLSAVRVGHLVHMNHLTGSGFDGERQVGIELTVTALAADDQVAITGLAQPGDSVDYQTGKYQVNSERGITVCNL